MDQSEKPPTRLTFVKSTTTGWENLCRDSPRFNSGQMVGDDCQGASFHSGKCRRERAHPPGLEEKRFQDMAGGDRPYTYDLRFCCPRLGIVATPKNNSVKGGQTPIPKTICSSGIKGIPSHDATVPNKPRTPPGRPPQNSERPHSRSRSAVSLPRSNRIRIVICMMRDSNYRPTAVDELGDLCVDEDACEGRECERPILEYVTTIDRTREDASLMIDFSRSVALKDDKEWVMIHGARAEAFCLWGGRTINTMPRSVITTSNPHGDAASRTSISIFCLPTGTARIHTNTTE